MTQSLLADFMGCRKLMWYKLNGWERPGSKGSIRFGNLAHRGLHDVYAAMAKGAIGNLERVLEDSIERELKRNLKDAPAADVAQDMELESLRATAVLGEYLNYWAEDLKREWVELETVFDTDFHGYRLRGRIDALFRQREICGRFVYRLLERKTKGRIDETALSLALGFDFQSLLYIFGVRDQLGDPAELSRVLYDVIRNPQLRQKKTEDQRGFIERIKADAKDRPEHYYKRFEIPFAPDELAESEVELTAKLDEFRMWLDGDLPTYRNQRSCIGLWPCEFLGACASGGMAGYSQTRVLFRELIDDDEEGGSDGEGEQGNTGQEAGGRKRKAKGKRAKA